MRFIVLHDIKYFKTHPGNQWLLPGSMLDHDFREGPLVPNKWFPAWCKLGPGLQHTDQPFEIRRWCEKNCQGDVVVFSYLGVMMGFQYREDAMLFSLTYQDIIVDQGTELSQ